MNAVDIGILLFVLFGLWRGWRSGLIALVVGIVSFIIAYLVALAVNQPVAAFFQAKLVPLFFGGHPPAIAPQDYRVVALLLVLVVGEGLLGSVTGLFRSNWGKVPVVGLLNRVGGAVLGAAEYALFASVLLLVLGPLFGVHSTFGAQVTHSAVFQQVVQRWEPAWLKPAA